MKKYIALVLLLILLYVAGDYVRFHTDWYISLHTDCKVATFSRADEDTLYLNKGEGYEPFEVKGVDMGSGIPGEWSTDFAIDEETYLRWFKQIKEMGANTIRIYTVQSSPFYSAFYKFNLDNPDPLYLIHGVWVNDYVQNSHVDAYDKSFFGEFQKNCKTMVNVIHGNCKLNLGEMASAGHGTYEWDISQWVIGYILGVEWEDVTVAYTDEKFKANPEYTNFRGTYMYTTEDATPFENLLAKVGESTIRYESERYGTQRLVAFSNWPTTDPFTYPEIINKFFEKCAQVNVEHIKTTEKFLSGQFASYHVYPYYPDYLSYAYNWEFMGLDDEEMFYDENGRLNTYSAYLTALTKLHNMPVVISEFGVSTGRGIAQIDQNTDRNQGHMSETEQGKALTECYRDIMDAGCAGGCIFTWQDEWFKRTWNTMYAIDMKRNPYWSDYQTNEQYFGVMSFDPGEEECVCYVDGDVSEWKDTDVVSENKDLTLSMKYDERFMYFLVHKPGLDIDNDKIFIPIDTTPKSGTTWYKAENLLFDQGADFVIRIDGKSDSKVLVQEYYEALRANYAEDVYGFNTYFKNNIPEVDSPVFKDINLILRTTTIESLSKKDKAVLAETFNTGKLLYGNANPDSSDFNSLADFMAKGDYIEVKIPWELLNFADPSLMEIHDDYYTGDNYGVNYMKIDHMNIGISEGKEESERRIEMDQVPLKGWKNDVKYHERLKPSYYIMQNLWMEN